MNRFENNLRNALREPKPPGSLTARILANADSQTRRQDRFFTHKLRIAAALVLVAVLAATGFQYERRRAERIAEERAREQVLEAFRLAEQQLKPFRKRLELMTIPSPQGEKQ
jgi:hypothetical protein